MILKEFVNTFKAAVVAALAAGTTQGSNVVPAGTVQRWTTNIASGACTLGAGGDDVGSVWLIRNEDATNALSVFPPTGGSINAAAANAAFSVAAGKSVLVVLVTASATAPLFVTLLSA